MENPESPRPLEKTMKRTPTLPKRNPSPLIKVGILPNSMVERIAVSNGPIPNIKPALVAVVSLNPVDK